MTECESRPLTAEVALARGGRWTSLRTPEREWLWHHPDPAVTAARAADQRGSGHGVPKISRSLRRVSLIDFALFCGKPSSSMPFASGEPP